MKTQIMVNYPFKKLSTISNAISSVWRGLLPFCVFTILFLGRAVSVKGQSKPVYNFNQLFKGVKNANGLGTPVTQVQSIASRSFSFIGDSTYTGSTPTFKSTTYGSTRSNDVSGTLFIYTSSILTDTVKGFIKRFS